MAWIRPVALFFILCLALTPYTVPFLPTIYSLLRLPFVWRSSAAQSLISQEHDGFDLTFSNYSTNYWTSGSGFTPSVPAKLHHIHLGSHSIPKEWQAARAQCLSQHESWETFLWDDKTASQFRVDALRYMILQVYGGAILDYDLACKRPLEPLRRFEFVAPAARPTGFSVGMMLSAPGTSFATSLVENLPRFNRRWLLLPYATVMFNTGCHYAS
ncbi:hypothetical protein BDW74DRAFT_172643 [Aspergillus multicolor]|uniref:uncharacterized protein n=1 Tax=Aspergillus multicolor TaxID=41759 RepID=UPI003CCD4312